MSEYYSYRSSNLVDLDKKVVLTAYKDKEKVFSTSQAWLSYASINATDKTACWWNHTAENMTLE